MRKKTPSHRAFEMLVSRIEGILAPRGVVVTSPDRIPTLTTGKLREVDASIRYKLGSIDVLITVECRERSRAQEVTWIEQLATKKAAIGAMHTIAVSSKGFSEEALTQARLLGIGTRLCEDVKDADILSWANELTVIDGRKDLRLGEQVEMHWYEGPGGTVDLDPTVALQLKELGWKAPIFLEQPDGQARTLLDIIVKAHPPATDDEGQGLVAAMPQAGVAFFSPTTMAAWGRTFKDGETRRDFIDCPRGEYLVETSAGRLSLKRIIFEVIAKSIISAVPLERVVEYSDDGQTIGIFAERRVRWEGEEWVITTRHPQPPPRNARELLKVREVARRVHRPSPAPPRAVRHHK
jgi:hypothetical protein